MIVVFSELASGTRLQTDADATLRVVSLYVYDDTGVVSSPPPAPPPPSPPPLSGAGSWDTSEVFGNAPASAAPTAPKTLQCALGSYVDAVTVHLSHTVVTGYTLQYVGALQRRGSLPLRFVAAAVAPAAHWQPWHSSL